MILLDPDLDADFSPALKRRSRSAHSAGPEKQDRLPSPRALSVFLRSAQAAVGLKGGVSVLLTTDDAIRRLNRQFRRKNKPTDVLSFPAGAGMGPKKLAGDLAVSVETAARQAALFGHPLATEIKVLMLHGLLHLAGYDHEADRGEMARRERLLRGRLKLPLGLIERTAAAGRRTTADPSLRPLRKLAPRDGKKKKAGLARSGKP